MVTTIMKATYAPNWDASVISCRPGEISLVWSGGLFPDVMAGIDRFHESIADQGASQQHGRENHSRVVEAAGGIADAGGRYFHQPGNGD